MSMFKTTLRTGIAVLALTFAGGVFSNAAQAQNAAPPAQQAQPVEISEAQLQKFAVANQKVVKLQQEYQSKAGQAQNKQELQALVDATNADIKQAIQESGLTVNEFNVIASALQSDAQLLEDYKSIVNAG